MTVPARRFELRRHTVFSVVLTLVIIFGPIRLSGIVPTLFETFAGDQIELADPAVAESSGLVASVQQPGVIWTFNDSGDGPRLFAFNEQGQLLARIWVEGATNRDWEAIAVGPDAAGNPHGALYIGDTGDNFGRQSEVIVYRIPEPSLADITPSQSPVVLNSAPAEAITLRYPDGAQDAETLLVQPRTGAIVIVTKDPEMAAVYVAERYTAGASTTLTHAADLVIPGLIGATQLITDGNISPAGDQIVLRTYVAAWVWEWDGYEPISDTLQGDPVRVALPITRQGEGISYTADGEELLISSEGRPAIVHIVEAPDFS